MVTIQRSVTVTENMKEAARQSLGKKPIKNVRERVRSKLQSAG